VLLEEAGGRRDMTWPSGPLVEWPLEELELFFETLELLVKYEGEAQ